MKSEKSDKDFNIYSRNTFQANQAPTIVSSTTNFISEDVHQNVPNSETNFISKGNKEKSNNDKSSKRKIKQVLKLKDNILVLNKNKEKKNIEIYNYLMKNEDMNNIQNIKELNELYDPNQLLNYIFSRLNKNQILKCNIFFDSTNNNNYILYSHTHKFILSAKYDFSIFHNNYNKNLANDVILMENSKPKYDMITKKYVDNYSERVKEKSKFNFKIIYKDYNNDGGGVKSIESGKINENNFTLDIGYPFSPLEGFALALANFVKNK